MHDGGATPDGREKMKKQNKKHRGHEYGMCVPCDLNIHDMTISMS